MQGFERLGRWWSSLSVVVRMVATGVGFVAAVLTLWSVVEAARQEDAEEREAAIAEASVPEEIVYASTKGGVPELYVSEPSSDRPTNLSSRLDSYWEIEPSWSPDGEQIAYVAWDADGGNYDLWVTDRFGEGEYRVVRTQTDERAPKWSPDNSRILFHRKDTLGRDQLFALDLSTGEEARLTAHGGSFGDWSPAGDKLVYQREEGGATRLFVLDLLEGTTELLRTGDGNAQHPDWSPDSRMIAYASNRSGDWEIYTFDLETGASSRVTDSQGSDHSPDWSHDGNELAFQSDRSGENSIYVSSRNGTNTRQVLSSLDSASDARWSADTALMVLSGREIEDSDLNIVGGTRELGEVLSSGSDDVYPALSGDQSQVAFSSNRMGTYDIWVASRDGTNLRRLTSSADRDVGPRWSNDGRTLVFMRGQSGDEDVWMVSLDDRTETRLSFSGGRWPDWSPTEDVILYSSARYGHSQLYEVSIDTGVESLVEGIDMSVGYARWSPDGRAVVFSSSDAGNYDVYVYRFDEGSDQVSQLTVDEWDDDWPNWAPDGESIVYASERGDDRGLYVISTSGGDPVEVVDLAPSETTPDW